MIISVVIAVLYVLVVLLLPIVPVNRSVLVLPGLWLFAASLLRYAAMRSEATASPIRWIPLAFAGDLGRFQVRPRGDGRRVEVRAGSLVVAEAVATESGDELLIDFEAALDSELDAFGAAIGQAIDMVVAAGTDRPAERASGWPPRRI